MEKKKHEKSQNQSLIEKLSDPNHKVDSKFLKEFYEENRRVNAKKSGFNPRDPLGKRLSEFWKYCLKKIDKTSEILDQETRFSLSRLKSQAIFFIIC